MYEKVSTELNFVEREKSVLSYWKENDIFNKSIAMRENSPVYTFYDGPPTANGKPHIGHIITRAVKDIIPRYKTMKGYKVLRKAGWDTHGLPVELEVEKTLGIDGKPEIEKYGIEPFIQKCKESVWKYESEWREMSDRVGFWADMDDPYITYKNDYIESVWWALKEIWKQKLLYKGHRIVPYCPRCGTALSSHEVAQGYKDVKEKSVYAKFKRAETENEYFLAWTTTPWTLPSNVGLCVNAKEDYARVEYNGEVLCMASALVEPLLKEGFNVIETMKGKALEHSKYEPLFDFVKAEEDETAFIVVCDDYVTLTDGSGIVHIAPAFGEDDSRIGKAYNLKFAQYVNPQGKFTPEVSPWADMFVKDADPLIIKDLKMSGKLFAAVDYEHSYPFCWRCDTPLIYYARDSWFIRMSAVRDKLLENNDKINWMPDNIKRGRFGNWLENIHDWNLSRERYWGTPLPVWECACGCVHAIGSIAELKEMSDNCPDDIELHKPFIDAVTVKCPDCGGVMKRVSEVIDGWFDSGSMPFAQWHYPFENKEMFDNQFPADFISEAIDQTRGWFYTLHAISTVIFGSEAYKNCIVLGHVGDKDGVKMSKHKGNVVDPWLVLNNQGADAIRWYFYVSSALWLNNRFTVEAVSEIQRKYIGTLWNTYAFYVLYAEIDKFDPTKYALNKAALCPMDRWVLSKLNSLVDFVDKGLEDYKITETARALNVFADELSNWYVRRCRERFWANGMEQDKIDAYMTLYTCLETLAKLSAPYTPFISEMIYKNIVKSVDSAAPESIHFCDFPAVFADMIDEELERSMDTVLNIVIAGRAARNTANIKNRQPVALLLFKCETPLSEEYLSIIRDELNVKEVRLTADVEGYVSYKFKPQLKTLGKKYGKLVPKIAEMLDAQNGRELMAALNRGIFETEIEGEKVELSIDDVLITTVRSEGFVSEDGKGCTVVLSTELTPELIEEGFVREVCSKIQNMRKEAGFEVIDKIDVSFEASETLKAVIEKRKAEIAAEVLAENFSAESFDGFTREWSINGENATFTIRKV